MTQTKLRASGVLTYPRRPQLVKVTFSDLRLNLNRLSVRVLLRTILMLRLPVSVVTVRIGTINLAWRAMRARVTSPRCGQCMKVLWQSVSRSLKAVGRRRLTLTILMLWRLVS